jgi:hypothetical protein
MALGGYQAFCSLFCGGCGNAIEIQQVTIFLKKIAIFLILISEF